MSWLFVPQLRLFLWLAAAASLILNLALLVPALYMVQVFDRVFASRSIETLAMLTVLAALALSLSYFMDALRGRALAWAGRTLERRLAPTALAQVVHQAVTPAAAGRANTDVLRDLSSLRAFLTGSALTALLDAPWLPLYVLVIGLMHPLLGVTALLGAVVLVIVGAATERLTRGLTEEMLQQSRATSRRAELVARNAEVVVGMGMTRAVVADWQRGHERLLQLQSDLAGRAVRLAALARLLRQVLQVVMLGLGAWLVIDAAASPGIMVATTILLGRALQPVEHLIAGWKQQLDARGAWQRLSERRLSERTFSAGGTEGAGGAAQRGADRASRSPASVPDSASLHPGYRGSDDRRSDGRGSDGRGGDGRRSDDRRGDGRRGDGRGSDDRRGNANGGERGSSGLALPEPRGRLQVERVLFGHTAQRPPLIKGVQFTIEAGESLGIVGHSASGKTTLARLLLGIWQPQAGCVRLDGADIAQWDRDALGAFLGYLPQDVELFPGTVAENIARLGAVDDAKVVDAARLAHAHEMVLRLPQGYDTQIGAGGALLSGGQRQRIALARAVYGEPKLIVLDEPNANLDAEGDEALRAALATLKQRSVTVVLIGHRPALMAGLDKLAVLRDGVLVAFGPSATVLPQLMSLATPKRPLAAVENNSPIGAAA